MSRRIRTLTISLMFLLERRRDRRRGYPPPDPIFRAPDSAAFREDADVAYLDAIWDLTPDTHDDRERIGLLVAALAARTPQERSS